MPEKLFLIDGMAMIYRAYFAMISSPLINSKGKNTSAVFGFVNSLVKLIEDEKPDHIAVCFDTAAPTFRHKEFPEYKAHRDEIPTDMPWQIDKTKEVVKAMSIPMIELDGYEADDIIGTLVTRAEKENVQSYMVTPDKDYMQLVTDKTFLYKPSRNTYGNKIADVEIIDRDGVIRKFGVPPEKVIDMLGLMGDTSDNIPGVKGVGEKTAKELIDEFGSIENIYRNIDKVSKPKLREKLINDKKNAFLSEMLVTIKKDVPIKIDFHELNLKEPDRAALSKLFEDLEFRTLRKKFSPEGDAEPKLKAAEIQSEVSAKDAVEEPSHATVIRELKTIKNVPHEYRILTAKSEIKKLAELLSASDTFCFDTETDSIDPMTANLVGISFSVKEFEGFYIPVKYQNTQSGGADDGSLFGDAGKSGDQDDLPDVKAVLQILRPVLEDRSKLVIGQNLKYDELVMMNYGVDISGRFFDTLIGAYILRPEGSHDMDSLSVKYLNYKPIPISALIGKGKEQITMDKVDVGKAGEYAAEDTDVTLQLFYRIKYELGKSGLLKLCTEIEFPLVRVLTAMEFEGFKVDENILSVINTQTEKLIKEYEQKIYKSAGEKFNINSTQQLAHILFEKLSLTPLRKTKTGYSTDVKVLEELKYQHEIASQLVDYRILTKLKSTYLDGLKKAINPKTGRVHTEFNQVASATGRLSSNNPNLQNIPIRTEVGRSLRKAFVPRDKSYQILSADYSQIELRIMAHYADDANMISAFRRNHDIHTDTAMRVFNLNSKNDVTPGMRRKAKEVNFGIIYGIGAFGLASRLEIKNSEAKDIIDRYFSTYPNVRDYMERTKKFAHDNGYVETLLGRRRYLSQINNANAAARAEDERAAINMPIQGTAADMIKIAMVNIHNEFIKKKFRSKMLLQVHDELVFEVKKDELEEVRKIVVNKMENALKLNVPIVVETGVGDNWYDAH